MAFGSLAALAAEPAAKGGGNPASPPAAPPAPAADAEILVLPKIEVTATRVKELDRAIKKLDKAIAREKKRIKPSELDKALNNPKLAEAGAVFGGNSSAYLEAVAATRIQYMETERDLLSDLKVPRTLEDFKMIEKELEQVRTMQRDLDKASH